jgi:hypothetical protein
MAGEEERAYYGYFLGLSALMICINQLKIFETYTAQLTRYTYAGYLYGKSNGSLSLQSTLDSVKNEDIPKDIEFVACIVHCDSYFGSYPGYLKDGFHLFGHKFPPGYYEDFFFYLFNNNFILSMVTATKGLYYSRFMRITNHFASTTLGFYLFVLTEYLSRYEEPYVVIIIQVLFISPSIMVINKILSYFFACTMCPKHFQANKACCRKTNPIFDLFILALWTGGVFWILLAAISTRDFDSDYKKLLSSYIYSAQLIAIASDALDHFMKMGMGHSYYKIKFCCIPIYEIGCWYNEYIEKADVPSTSYVEKTTYFWYFCGLIQVYSKIAVAVADQRIKSADIETSNPISTAHVVESVEAAPVGAAIIPLV